MNPLKPSLKSEWLPLSLIILSVALAGYFYAVSPATVPIHWGINGQPDGYAGRAFAACLMPGIALVLYLLMTFLPRLDPKKDQYAAFGKQFAAIRNLMLVFLLVLGGLAGWAGTGREVRMDMAVACLVGLLFISLGYYVATVKQNWFMGARTPWTMSSPEVWRKTNRLMGYVMAIAGLMIAATALAPVAWAKVALFATAIAGVILIPIIASYVFYRKEQAAAAKR